MVKVNLMVDIIEVKSWTTLKAAFVVDVKSLEDLKVLADAYGEPYILRHNKEHLLFHGSSTGGISLCYRYKG